jgi:hypothetical protein
LALAASILALTFAFVLPAGTQTSDRAISKGPRAVGLLEFDDKKQAHLVPVVVMVNGEFYDASAYKAAPVPMALETDTIYEGVRTGISEGLFTIKRAHEVLGVWAGEGNWVPNSAKPKEKKPLPKAPADDIDKPPVLRRHGAEKPSPGGTTPATSTPPPATPPAPPATAPESAPDTHTITVGGPIAQNTHQHSQKAVEPIDDSERPVLRRGKPEQQIDAGPMYDTKGTSAWTVVGTIPALSDAKPETPRAYNYTLKPEQEQDLRTQMLALASKALAERTGATASPVPAHATRSHKPAAAPKQNFEDVELRAYDPSTNNEPVYVLSANAKMPDKSSGKDVPYHVLLIVRQDIYAEMHVLFSGVSDPDHMDSQPRCDFLDVVDADGDGYGELLLRRTYDSGRAYSVYRVIGNQLWPLFEGKP